MTEPGLGAASPRAGKDILAALLARAAAAGVRFRWAGVDLLVDGQVHLPPADQAALVCYFGEIRERLALPGDADDILERFDATMEVIADEARAREVVAALPPAVGLDIETEAPNGKRAWLKITRQGKLAKVQPKADDESGLSPRHARPRLVQVYSPAERVVYVFDLHAVPLEALAGLWQRQLWIHNAGFEHAMLGAQGVALRDTIDTQQMAGQLFGCQRGVRKLETVSKQVLEVPISKAGQLSDWSAPRLTTPQVRYAAVDAVVAYLAGQAMHGMMDERLRRCFRLQNRAVPVVAKMRLAGVPFDRSIHLETIARWERELTGERARFVAVTGEEPPARHKVGPWVEARLPAEEIAWMPRTQAGGLSARSDLLKYLAHHEEIRPLLRVLWARSRLERFGHSWIELIDPVTGRIYPDYLTCGAKTGRFMSSRPNAQQLPADGRAAITAPAGRLLVVGDLDQIELRVFAELADEQVMRGVFAAGGDIHRRTAAAISGVPESEIEDPRRKAAKAVNFGIVFAAGADRIRASAWSKFDIDMRPEEARAARAAVLRAYPAIYPYQQRQAELGLNARVLHSVAGRPLRANWEKNAELRYTICANFAVQGSAADIMLRSMALLDRALARLDAQLILPVHDELVVEAAEDVADEAGKRLNDAMAQAFSEFFPNAPFAGLVDVRVVRSWSEAE